MSDRDPSDLSPREGCPVHDWATDFDVMDEGYIKDPAPVWEELRDTCPIAHTTRWGGAWLPTKYDDVREWRGQHPRSLTAPQALFRRGQRCGTC